MAKMKLFGKNIAPACAYCAKGAPSQDNRTIICERYGFTQPSYQCSKFIYDPLKRVPRRAPLIRRFSSEDFEL